mgnify:CR=1 FL=1
MLANGRFIANAGEVEVTHGVQCSSFELQALVAFGAQNADHTLTLARQGGAHANDVFSATGALSVPAAWRSFLAQYPVPALRAPSDTWREIDSLVPARGSGGGEPQVTARVVNTILAEMDGMEELNSIVVIGATNRPALVDPALLRPGRFDELIYVGVPDREGRRRILGIHSAGMPLAAE